MNLIQPRIEIAWIPLYEFKATMRDSILIQERNQAIYDKYCEMYFGEMKREEVIWPILKKQFFLEENTIYRIVLQVSKEASQTEDKE